MNTTRNPMLVQFWLWGLDAIAGDLSARGFQKLERPNGSDSSVYRLENLHLHGHGLWLETEGKVLIYRRPSKAWYALPKSATLCVEHFKGDTLAWCDFARPQRLADSNALETVRPIILEHEAWIVDCHGPQVRDRQLERVLSRPVRRARPAWREWFGLPVAEPNY